MDALDLARLEFAATTGMHFIFVANEVWLIGFAGVLIAAFPTVEAGLLTGFYPVVVALIVAWLVRDASVWFRGRRPSVRWRGRWDAALTAASVALAAAAGIFVGNAAQGYRSQARIRAR